MIPTLAPPAAFRRVFISAHNIARFSCSAQTRNTLFGRDGLAIISGNSSKAARASNLTQALIRVQSRAACSYVETAAVAKPSSILAFISSNVWRATHRSGGSSFAKPPPRGPWQRLRDSINRIPNKIVFWTIMILNGGIFAAWQYSHAVHKSTGDGSYILWMRRHFTTSMQNFSNGRMYTVLTSCFSHELTGHLLLNAFSFYFMAPPVLGALGNVGFLGLYLGGGIVSSFVSLWWNKNMKHSNYSSHGASGALYSVITFFACAAPRTTFYLFAVVPMPAWLCVSGLFLYDAYSSVYERGGSTDTAGHVGGVLAGAAYFLAKVLRIF